MKNIPEIIEKRARLFAEVRRFFDERGFVEVDTPLLYPFRDMTVNLADFTTAYRDGEKEFPLSLPTSPEVYMKRLLAAGAEKIYQICPFFRNGEVTQRHNPEFAGLEFYEAGADYHGIMDTTTELLKTVFYSFGKRETLNYSGHEVNISGDWRRVTLSQAVQESSGVDITGKATVESLRQEIEARGYHTDKSDSYDDLFFRAYLADVENSLGVRSPVWLYDYPKQMAAYARLKPDAPDIAERCELYIAGVELANGFSELNDSQKQRRRFLEWAHEKNKQTGEEFPIDENFIKAVGEMPDCAGIAIGLERILMLICDTDKIAEVIPFAFME